MYIFILQLLWYRVKISWEDSAYSYRRGSRGGGSAVADPEISEKEVASGRGNPSPEIAKILMYFASKILALLTLDGKFLPKRKLSPFPPWNLWITKKVIQKWHGDTPSPHIWNGKGKRKRYMYIIAVMRSEERTPPPKKKIRILRDWAPPPFPLMKQNFEFWEFGKKELCGNEIKKLE